MRMNKLLTTTAALTVMVTGAYAAGMNGAYAGAQLGYNSTSVKYNETDNSTYNLTIDGLSAKGADYGLFAGYGQTVGGSNVYLGGEAEYTLSNAENKLSAAGLGTAGDVTTKKKDSYGGAIRAGYVMGNVMPYARVGYNRAEFKQTATGLGSQSESKGGVAYGIGMEYAPCDNIGLRGEFVRTSYGKIDASGGGITASYKPVENVARVGLAYRF
jgi:opacity protein-like surface antigen